MPGVYMRSTGIFPVDPTQILPALSKPIIASVIQADFNCAQ
jgi:hypothetical protein